MNILVTGSSGFVGRNLVENLKNIRDGKDRTRPGIKIDVIYEYDVQNTREELDMFALRLILYLTCRSEPPQGPEGIYGGKFWLCIGAS